MSQQTPEAEAFLKHVASLPQRLGVLSLDDVLQPSIDDEAELRKLYATEKANERLKNLLVGLVDVFAAPADIRTTRARVAADDEELSAKYVMPLSEADRRKEGQPCMVGDFGEFKKNWAIFTEGSLSQLFDWNNVVAAGGAVLACLSPLSDAVKESKRTIRKYYHSVAYPTSDIDLFLWGMSTEQAEKKIIAIYEAVRDSVPWDVTCVRTRHTVSIHSQYPYRSIQIVLRLYSSPAEVLTGFDIDAPSCLYNGERVFATPRSIVSMMRQANTVDMTRRSPSYEVRLAKYSTRGFEVLVPSLERDKVDPTIYERSITGIQGLARLLVLEKLYETDARNRFLHSRRVLRGRPRPEDVLYRYRRRKNKYKGDLKVDTSIMGLEMNDYDVASLHIPYGPGWTARRIDKLVYQTDLGMNSTFNPKNKGRRLHRHPAFFGTMKECLEDCCEFCPSPIDADERALQAEEDKQYIRGRISFIEEDPGRQSMTGSFNPIDVGEWSTQLYIGQTEALFNAIALYDREAVAKLIANGVDINRRDHVGRKALHVAILVKAEEIACDLVDAGAQMMSRLVDGRNALHLAAHMDMPGMVRKLVERSLANKEKAGKEGKTKEEGTNEAGDNGGVDETRLSSEDDWTSEDDGVISMNTDEEVDDEGEGRREEDSEYVEDEDEDEADEDDAKSSRKENETAEAEDGSDRVLDDANAEEPDILDINLPDWDLGFTPLCHAIFSGTVASVEALLEAGADPVLPIKGRDTLFHPLAVTILKEDEDEACKIAERLISAGASSSAAEANMVTIFHRAVMADKVKLVATILRCDPNADAVLNFPSKYYSYHVTFPVVNAINSQQYAMLATLLAHGVKLAFKEEDIPQAGTDNAQLLGYGQSGFSHGSKSTLEAVALPLETDVARLLITLGAEYNTTLRCLRSQHTPAEPQMSMLDWVRLSIDSFKENNVAPSVTPATELDTEPEATGWKRYIIDLVVDWQAKNKGYQARFYPSFRSGQITPDPQEIRSYLCNLEEALVAKGAESWKATTAPSSQKPAASTQPLREPMEYSVIERCGSGGPTLPQYQAKLYEELFEACFVGDNERVQAMCLPPKGSDVIPLCIFVQASDPRNRDQSLGSGYTPLFAAVAGRRWTTAKLILAIAAAQYKPKDQEKMFSTKGISLDDDDAASDSGGSCDSHDSDTTAEERKEVTFIDVAKKPSVIETSLHPEVLLKEAYLTLFIKKADGTYNQQYDNLLGKAVIDDDLEAFVNILGLYRSSPLPITVPSAGALDKILQYDRPEMLDEHIRRTGDGIDFKAEGDGDTPTATNDRNRLYLGLSVHGKKRADLAKKIDPNANAMYRDTTHPIVWRAALKGATAIVDYLAGERPVAAYKYYASTNSDEVALKIRSVQDLEKALPLWLGWRATDLGDSPLMAAVLGGKVETLQKLFTRQPKLLGSCLHQRIKFIGYNALMFAAHCNSPVDVIDFLLLKSISPVEIDRIRGWNIYHIICNANSYALLEHCLAKLPRDVNEALLAQQSKGRSNTPLHIAVKRGFVREVELIVGYTTSTLLIRDIDGSTPLYCAVQRGFGAIVKAIVKIAPKDALYMENGVGETPLDMSILQHTLETIRKFPIQTNYRTSISMLGVHMPPSLPPTNLDVLEKQLLKLRETILRLKADGRLVKGTKVSDELDKFSAMMYAALLEAQAKKDAQIAKRGVAEDKGLKSSPDSQNRARTMNALNYVVRDTPRKRLLVHIFDVQRSVRGNLAQYADKAKLATHFDDKDGLDDGREDDEKEGSLVLGHVVVQPDTL